MYKQILNIFFLFELLGLSTCNHRENSKDNEKNDDKHLLNPVETILKHEEINNINNPVIRSVDDPYQKANISDKGLSLKLIEANQRSSLVKGYSRRQKIKINKSDILHPPKRPAALPFGTMLPDFSLVDVMSGEKLTSRKYFNRELSLVVFTSNNCQFSRLWESKILQIYQEFNSQPLKFILINPVDARTESESADQMWEHGKNNYFPIPYLKDGKQKVARIFGAIKLPHVFLFSKDKGLIYRGIVDDSHISRNRPPKEYLKQAIKTALAGGKIDMINDMKPIGCAIKWK